MSHCVFWHCSFLLPVSPRLHKHWVILKSWNTHDELMHHVYFCLLCFCGAIYILWMLGCEHLKTSSKCEMKMGKTVFNIHVSSWRLLLMLHFKHATKQIWLSSGFPPKTGNKTATTLDMCQLHNFMEFLLFSQFLEMRYLTSSLIFTKLLSKNIWAYLLALIKYGFLLRTTLPGLFVAYYPTTKRMTDFSMTPVNRVFISSHSECNSKKARKETE